MTKELVKENVTRHEGSQEKAPSPLVGEGWGEGFTHNDKYEPRPCGCNTRELVNNRFPARKGWGLRDGKPQSLIHDKNLTSYRLNVLTTFKKAAFTLAEVLIALGVIGIVAAMTIPTLVQNYKEKVTVTKVKKMYSVLSNAYEMSKLENEQEFVSTGTAAGVKVADLFKPYLKVVKDCGNIDLSCLTDTNYKNKLGINKVNYNRDNSYYKLALNDGSVLIFRGGHDYGDFKYNFEILFDVNGKGGPNQWGYDLFEFDEYKGQIRPCGFVKDWEQTCPTEETGYTCAAWIISKGNMDYLK